MSDEFTRLIKRKSVSSKSKIDAKLCFWVTKDENEIKQQLTVAIR